MPNQVWVRSWCCRHKKTKEPRHISLSPLMVCSYRSLYLSAFMLLVSSIGTSQAVFCTCQNPVGPHSVTAYGFFQPNFRNHEGIFPKSPYSLIPSRSRAGHLVLRSVIFPESIEPTTVMTG